MPIGLTNYTDLKDTVVRWAMGQDITDVVETLIYLNEVNFNGKLFTRWQITITAVNTVANDPLLPMPDDFLAVQSLFQVDQPQNQYINQQDNFTQVLYANAPGYNPPSYITTGNNLYLYPTPTEIIPLTLVYWAKFPNLSSTVADNDLLLNEPDIYLYGTLLHAEPYMVNDPRMATWEKLYTAAMDRLVASSNKARRGMAPVQAHIGGVWPRAQRRTY